MRQGSLGRLLGAIVLALVVDAGSEGQCSPPVDPQAVAQHLAAALRFRTISHQDPGEDERSEFAGFRELLERTYPKLHAALAREIVNGDGLLYRWEGSDASAPAVLFMAHYDVVPVEPGTEDQWTHPPFGGVVADGFVWGRGATDDKGSLICLMEAAESLLSDGFRPARTIYIASGFDEEVGGERGAAEIAGLLRSRGIRLDYVLDEGQALSQGIIPGVADPIASIGIAEKGYVSLELTIGAEGGHSSRPPAETAIGILAAAIDRLERRQMPARLDGASRQLLQALAPHLPLGRRLLLSNLWLFSPLVVRGLASDATTNTLVRTTTAPTIFAAGVKENVLPSKARAVVNFRILPGDSVEEVREHVRRVVDDRIEIRTIERMVSDPSPTSSADSPAYHLIAETIGALFPGAVVAPSLVVAATDSRHFAAIAVDVYRFMPLRFGPGDLERGHGTDERFEITQIPAAVEFYRRLMSAPRPARSAMGT